jgi:hypothetical protein
MRIILEGPDGCGKTTLAHDLQKWLNHHGAFPVNIHHEGPPPPKVKLLEHYGNVLLSSDEHTIFDRLALGELIYGPILRGEDRLGEVGWRVFRRLLTARNVLHIICILPWERALANWSVKHVNGTDLVTRAEQYHRVYTGYVRRVENADESHVVYDYTTSSLSLLKDLIILRGKQKAMLPYLIGAPGATNLFLGDRGANPDCTVDLPFFATEGSSRYLHDALEVAAIPEHQMFFMNARNNSGFMNAIPYTPSMRVVALGVHAARACISQDVPYEKVPHPQWWRRFRFHEVNKYAKLLRGER